MIRTHGGFETAPNRLLETWKPHSKFRIASGHSFETVEKPIWNRFLKNPISNFDRRTLEETTKNHQTTKTNEHTAGSKPTT